MIFKHLVVAALFAFLAACSAPPQAALDADEIAHMLEKKKNFKWIGFGFSGHARLASDGTIKLGIDNIGADKGHWFIVKDAFCVQFERALAGQRHCAEIAPLPNATYEARAPKRQRRLGIIYPQKER